MIFLVVKYHLFKIKYIKNFKSSTFCFLHAPDALACLAGISTISRCIVYLEMGLLDFPSSDVSHKC